MGQQGEPCVVRRQNAERERGQVSANELYWQDLEHRTSRRSPPTLVCFFNTVLRGDNRVLSTSADAGHANVLTRARGIVPLPQARCAPAAQRDMVNSL